MEEKTIRQLLDEVKTPSYIFDTDEFARRAQLVRESFGEKTGLCFSIKVNPFLLGCLPDTFDKIEVCSPGELTICRKTGADPSKIIFSGVNKTAEDVERAMEYGAGTFTAESFLHAELINNSAVKRGITVPVLVRVTGGSQFGMDEQDVIDLISRADEYKGIEDFRNNKVFMFSDIQKLIAVTAALFFFAVFVSEITPLVMAIFNKVFSLIVKLKGGI